MCVFTILWVGGIHNTLGWGSPCPHNDSVLQIKGHFYFSFYFFHYSWNGLANPLVGNKTIFYSDNWRTSQCQAHINVGLQKVLWSKCYYEALKQRSSIPYSFCSHRQLLGQWAVPLTGEWHLTDRNKLYGHRCNSTSDALRKGAGVMKVPKLWPKLQQINSNSRQSDMCKGREAVQFDISAIRASWAKWQLISWPLTAAVTILYPFFP